LKKDTGRGEEEGMLSRLSGPSAVPVFERQTLYAREHLGGEFRLNQKDHEEERVEHEKVPIERRCAYIPCVA